MYIYTGPRNPRQAKNTFFYFLCRRGKIHFLPEFVLGNAVSSLRVCRAECYSAFMDGSPAPATPAPYQILLEVAEAIASYRDLRELFHVLAERLHLVVEFDYLNLILHDAKRNVMRLHILETSRPTHVEPGLEIPVEWSAAGMVYETQQPLVIPDIEKEDRFPKMKEVLHGEGIVSLCILPLTFAQKRVGCLGFGRANSTPYADAELHFMQQVARLVAVAVDNALAYEEIAALKNRLAVEKLYLEDEIRSERNFEEIIGESPSLKKILKQVETVAPTESTVLLQGETGTGKELFARAIHNISPRRERTLVKINCAAIPTGLLESELFGHERGAFTGAIAQKIGRFELADGGTLFLDEVGDIPPELQPKLLRVLQEQEFERLGGTRTIRVNIRLVTATNRDLVQMVADRQFRSDLFYRLNVFPIQIPPLRQRREDIPVLVRYFAQKYARQMSKPVDTISTDTMAALTNYSWPGNIRELENLIERAVILSRGATLEVPLAELRKPADSAINSSESLEATERDHILRVLRDTGWVLAGPNGAAARLGMKRTTLQARMTKLRIKRPV
jgi:formate hydrogenlyase transcriptional activator